MRLKNYQRAALEKLEKFLARAQFLGAAQAFAEVAPEGDNPYSKADYKPPHGVADCPHVCLRLPTGGGKTLLAALSVAKVARYMQKEFPVVLWMTPSNTICKQTVEALKTPRHPYRAAMDADFRGRVEVWDIEQWQQIRPQDLSDRVCVVVATIQALRITDTNKRKVYAHNENLEPHFRRFPHDGLDLEKHEGGGVKFSFVNLLHIHRPLAIVDEAHNAVTGLTAELHRRLRPSCIIEFTATPRDKNDKQMHNVLVNVPATALRDEEMIKLPIELVEHATWQDAVNGAVATRGRLARIARQEGEAIRPVVLYQAQDKNRAVTVDALKKHLLENENIAPEKIAVATGDQRELDAIVINDPQCPVEHVITVQALKEGWDCPFAYVLCSVANVQSATSVEQLLGRVMRMPFARRRKHRELNRAYTHVPETQFSHAAHALRDKLVATMGFGKDEAEQAVQQALFDARDNDAGAMFEPEPEKITVARQPDFSACTVAEREAVARAVEIKREAGGGTRVIVKGAISKTAREAIVASVANPDERERIRHRLRHKNLQFERFRSPARRGQKFRPLPQLFLVFDGRELEASPENIESMMAWEPLKQDYLLSEREFSITETATGFKIDFVGAQTPELKVQEGRQWAIPELSEALQRWDEGRLARWLEGEIRTQYLTQEVLELFARHNVAALLARGHSLESLVRFKFLLARVLKEKLEQLRGKATKQNYQRVLFGAPAPVCRFQFKFSPDPLRYQYNHAYEGSYEFKKHYYGVIGDLKVKGEEYDCAIALDSSVEVEYWIRNVDRKPDAFWLPLPDDKCYPDFIAQLTDGRLLAVEYKGEHLYTAEKARLIRLIGGLWERKSAGKALFVMPSRKKDAPPIAAQIRATLRRGQAGTK